MVNIARLKKIVFVVLFGVLLGVLPIKLSAQDYISEDPESTDFRTRASVELGGHISDKFTWGWEEELRMKSSSKDFDKLYSVISFGYKPLSWLKISPEYTFILQQDTKKSGKKEMEYRHRAALNINASFKYGNWRFALRERPQATFRTDSINVQEKTRCNFVLRSRFTIDYSFRSVAIKPYVFVEMTNILNTPKAYVGNLDETGTSVNFNIKDSMKEHMKCRISKMRYAVGLEYKFDSHSSIDLNYRFDDGVDYKIHIKKSSHELSSVTWKPYMYHIVCVKYKYTF